MSQITIVSGFLVAAVVVVGLAARSTALAEYALIRGTSVTQGQMRVAEADFDHVAQSQPKASDQFVLKLYWENATGQMFFGTESLGNIGLPTPLAHAAGAVAALAMAIGFVIFAQSRVRGSSTTNSRLGWQAT